MKGGIFMRAIIKPLSSPAVVPVNRPTTMPTGTGKPWLVTATPVMTAESVITVPTERSMPAVMITNVTPSASTPLTAVATRMLLILSGVRKKGDASEKKMKIRIRAENASSFWAASARSSERFLGAAVAASVVAMG